MNPKPFEGSPTNSTLLPSLFFTTLFALCFLFGCEQRQTEDALESLTDSQRRALNPMTNTPFMVEGINSPTFSTASEATLRDDTPIIGVVIDGQARAYPLIRLSAMVDHVVNDQVTTEDGKVSPFTVTYCDMTDCVRVFSASDESKDEPMNVSTLGMLDGGLALRWNGVDFKQMDKVPMLQDVPFHRTTWGQWKAEHPESLVYKGRGPR